jgi:hypothetical protein
VNYTLEHIKAAFRAAKKGLSEAGFLNYLEFHSLLAEDAPTVKHGRKPSRIKDAKTPSPRRRGARGKVKPTVLAYLEKNREGKAGAIAKSSGLKPGSVNQVLFALKKSGVVTQDKKRGSPFVLAKK